LKFVFAENVDDVFDAALSARRISPDGHNGHGSSVSSEEEESRKTPRAAKKRG
jgi:hypothetical protein